MPNNDGTGPNGQGSRTGRGLGRCKPNQSSEKNTNSESNERGMGLGRGNRRGNAQGRNQRND